MTTQSLLTFERANPLSKLADVARTLALPHDFPPGRYPTFPVVERTAVMGFNAQSSLTVGTGYTRGMVARSPIYPLWAEQSRATDLWFCRYSNIMIDPVPGSAFPLAQPSIIGSGNNTTALNAQISGATTPPSSYPILGVNTGSNRPMIYVPGGYVVYANLVTSSAIGAAVGFQLLGSTYNAPGEESESGIMPLNAISTNYQAVGSKTFSTTDTWYRPESIIVQSGTTTASAWWHLELFVAKVAVVTPAATLSYTVVPTSTANLALLPFLPPPEWTNSTLPYSATRCTAVAALFTNVTKIQNKEGTVNAARLSPEVDTVWGFDNTTLAARHPAEKAYLNLENGFYTFCPPSSEMGTFISANTASGITVAIAGLSTTVATCPVFNLGDTSLVNAFSFYDSDGGTTLAVNVDWHIEFRTTSTLFPIALSTMSLETYHQAQLSVTQFGFFFNNANHESIRKLVSAGLRVPKGSPVGAAPKVKKVLIQPTSARTAGWMGPPAKTGLAQPKKKKVQKQKKQQKSRRSK